MNFRAIATASLLTALCALSPLAAPAQMAAPGDMVVTTSTAVLLVDRMQSPLRFSTLAALPGADYVLPASENDGLIVTSGRTLYKLKGNALNPLITLPAAASIQGVIVDQTGDYVVLSGADGRLYRVNRGGTSFSTFATVPRGCRALARDFDTGDFLVADGSTDGTVLAVSHDGARVDTLFTWRLSNDSARIDDIVHLPHSGLVATLSNGFSGEKLRLVDRSGTIQYRESTWFGAKGLTVDYERGRLLYSDDEFGYFLKSRSVNGGGSGEWTSPNVDFNRIAIVADRRATGIGSGQRGSLQTISFSFPSSPNAAFCGAISLGNRSAIPVGNGYQPIKPDALFFQTLCGNLPFFTQGFAGTTDATGKTSMAFAIPPFVPVGTRIYAAGSAFTTRIDPSNVVCVKVK